MLRQGSTVSSEHVRGRAWRRCADPDRTRPGTAVTVAALTLLLLAATTVTLLGDDRSPAPRARATGPTAPAVSAGRGGDSDVASDVGLAEAAAQVDVVEPLLVAPENVTWQLFMGVALPYSPTAGPAAVDGPVYRRFERSQAGALLAAVHLGTRYLLTPGEGWREVLDRQVLPGAGRDAFAVNRTGVDPQAPAGTYGQIAGFRVVTFTPDVAVVQLVSRFPTSGVLQVTTTTVRWVGGDWRLQLQPDGGTSPTAQAVPSLDGFVVWGA
jgi:hypothetical protein